MTLFKEKNPIIITFLCNNCKEYVGFTVNVDPYNKEHTIFQQLEICEKTLTKQCKFCESFDLTSQGPHTK